ncbi:Ku protein [Streptomyces sp. NPDC090445]|uniref:Ku protein n=1 Tax=Streptomyces sp. NPDC090445 TaxID=3365963 RepID=UPI00380A5857
MFAMFNPRSQSPSRRHRLENRGPRGEQYGKVYALLQRALAESNKVGIATFAMRGREYLVALKAEDDLLLRISGCRRVVTVGDPCGMPVR